MGLASLNLAWMLGCTMTSGFSSWILSLCSLLRIQEGAHEVDSLENMCFSCWMMLLWVSIAQVETEVVCC